MKIDSLNGSLPGQQCGGSLITQRCDLNFYVHLLLKLCEKLSYFLLFCLLCHNLYFMKQKITSSKFFALFLCRFVLSAAHCFCNDIVNYCTKTNDDGDILEDDSSDKIIDIIALIALNGGIRNIEDLYHGETKENHLRFVTKVISHHKFQKRQGSQLFPSGPDIALLKLDRPLKK